MDPTAIAEAYPKDVFVTADDQLISRYDRKADTVRERKLAEVAIPQEDLKQGVNVVAIEVCGRRMTSRLMITGSAMRQGSSGGLCQGCVVPYDLTWNTCGLTDVELKAGSCRGWCPMRRGRRDCRRGTAGCWTADVSTDFGDPCEPLGPVLIEGPRNGWSSGKVVIGSARRSRAEGDVGRTSSGRGPGEAGTIPAVRCGRVMRWRLASRLRTDTPLESVLEEPWDKFPVAAGWRGGGAVVPIWLTVKIPADDGAGDLSRGRRAWRWRGSRRLRCRSG